MSEYKNMIEISISKDTPKEEHFYYRNIQCPHCCGRGWVPCYDNPDQNSKTCECCEGTGKMRAHITVDYYPDYGGGEYDKVE